VAFNRTFSWRAPYQKQRIAQRKTSSANGMFFCAISAWHRGDNRRGICGGSSSGISTRAGINNVAHA